MWTNTLPWGYSTSSEIPFSELVKFIFIMTEGVNFFFHFCKTCITQFCHNIWVSATSGFHKAKIVIERAISNYEWGYNNNDPTRRLLKILLKRGSNAGISTQGSMGTIWKETVMLFPPVGSFLFKILDVWILSGRVSYMSHLLPDYPMFLMADSSRTCFYF